MDFNPLWTKLRDRCASLGPDEVLVTPASDAAFRVVATREDRIAVEFVNDGTLRRAAEGYVQKTGVNEAEKQSHLQGLRDRLADLEDRIDAVLAAVD
jgi:hypothetical protein